MLFLPALVERMKMKISSSLLNWSIKNCLSWTGVCPSRRRYLATSIITFPFATLILVYLWFLIFKYFSMISIIMVNWENISTLSPLLCMLGRRSSRILNLPESQIWWFPRHKCSMHWNKKKHYLSSVLRAGLSYPVGLTGFINFEVWHDLQILHNVALDGLFVPRVSGLQ